MSIIIQSAYLIIDYIWEFLEHSFGFLITLTEIVDGPLNMIVSIL